MTKTRLRVIIAKNGIEVEVFVSWFLHDTYPQIKKTYLSCGRVKVVIVLNAENWY